MKKLSSDLLFYRGFVGLIISPLFFVFLINVASRNNFSDTVRYSLYVILGMLLVFQWYKVFKTRKILYNKTLLVIKPYFFNKSIDVPLSSVTSIRQVFNGTIRSPRLFYKMEYVYEDKTYKIYFYKSLDLGSQDDLEEYLGVEYNENA